MKILRIVGVARAIFPRRRRNGGQRGRIMGDVEIGGRFQGGPAQGPRKGAEADICAPCKAHRDERSVNQAGRAQQPPAQARPEVDALELPGIRRISAKSRGSTRSSGA